jgi:hypothetical protein
MGINRRSFVPALIALVALHLSLAAPTYCQQNQDGKNDTLKLTVTLLGQHYCANREMEDSPVREAVVGTVSFDFRLRIQNVSDHAIILCRECVGADWPNLFDVQADGTRGVLRSEHMIEDCCGLMAPAHHPKRPDSDYPIIPRGGELEMDRSAGLGFVVFSEDHASNGIWVYPGRYFLQPRFVTWEQTDTGAKDLAGRWKSCGGLYRDEPLAEPMPISIEIEIQRDMPDCCTR